MNHTGRTVFVRTQPGGFTLIELLVVMSIISLMMSILLPSLSNAREQGKRVACVSNMRSLTQGWMMYALENDDALCSAETGWDVPPANHWVADGPLIPGNELGGTAQAIMRGTLWPYTNETLKLYKCRSDRTERLRSYAISRAMNGARSAFERDNIRPFHMWSQITQASERMVFVDADCRTPWMEGSFCAVRDIDSPTPEWYVRDSRNLSARHRTGCNVTFADTHCEYWRYRDSRTTSLANYEIGPQQASDHNPDLVRMLQLLQGKREQVVP
jgi:prepilin-type N-terminal cleavage/methylation domain-containing protein/prepilin-type processing-associated H-X9-DG protein